jgi:hypothetical protein
MSNLDGLNVGAYSFVPGGGDAPPTDNSQEFVPYDHTQDNVYDDIETEMDGDYTHQDNQGAAPPPPSPATMKVVASALPSHLAKHATEFWFPECRDCACCNGFKFGACACRTSHGARVCKCSEATTPHQEHIPAPYAPSVGGGGGGGYQQGGGGGDGYQQGGGGGGGGVQQGGGGMKSGPICKFFTSPNGCRFGDKCRFSHG